MSNTNRSGFVTFTRARSQLLGISMIAASSLCAVSGSAAVEKAKFDGYWSVDVVAVDGACRARTIRLEVREGEVTFAGFGATAEGAIGSNGRLQASIKHGDNVVRARGALKGELGQGKWASSKCAGHWTARRG